jgi:hypothetical protein
MKYRRIFNTTTNRKPNPRSLAQFLQTCPTTKRRKRMNPLMMAKTSSRETRKYENDKIVIFFLHLSRTLGYS